MGVDVRAVSGFTVKIPPAALEATRETVGVDDLDELYDELGLEYCHIGSSFSGDTETVLIFEPSSANNVDDQIREWLDFVNHAFGTGLTPMDAKFISDTYWY